MSSNLAFFARSTPAGARARDQVAAPIPAYLGFESRPRARLERVSVDMLLLQFRLDR